jgi:hypothetical protein
MKLTEALQKNGGYANNRSKDTMIQVAGEWGDAARDMLPETCCQRTER